MRAFILLALVAIARADVGGYNYEATAPHHGGSQQLSEPHHQHHEAPAELEKEFFTFTAPEHEFEDSQPVQDLASSVKKNLQVIFIKGPENNGLANAAAQLAKSATDSKTAIYVLTKQADTSELAHKLQNQHNHHASKPEVHFVKYRTPEDAQHAQHAIQQQYDQLGGSSQSHHGGVAPVLDFASKPAPHHGGGGAAPSTSYIPPQVPSNTYLPNFKF